MGLKQTLETGTKIETYNYDNGHTKGQAIGIKNNNGDYVPAICIESVKCSEGIKNRVVINDYILRPEFIIIHEIFSSERM